MARYAGIGPVIMLPFEGDGNQDSCSGDNTREPRHKRFLSVTEFTEGPRFTFVEKVNSEDIKNLESELRGYITKWEDIEPSETNLPILGYLVYSC